MESIAAAVYRIHGIPMDSYWPQHNISVAIYTAPVYATPCLEQRLETPGISPTVKIFVLLRNAENLLSLSSCVHDSDKLSRKKVLLPVKKHALFELETKKTHSTTLYKSRKNEHTLSNHEKQQHHLFCCC
jgi:hypothetical protein